ncbi:MAG TPA: pyruvate synthase subunit beta [Dehalococcoidia bacterium]|nr:pyruvate synthase subunit beta [Dehalococcoidia bacterium]
MAIKDLPVEELIRPGGGGCPGCPSSLAMRIALKALGRDTVLVIPACCAVVCLGGYPRTSVDVPVVSMAFEAAAAAASGLVAGYKRRNRTSTNVVVWAGDGGTYDIGLQALSGAVERGTDFLYICYNNEMYSNTGIQRSGATPYGAWTTTTWFGKGEQKKDLPAIMRAHGIRYMATAVPGYQEDLFRKVRKAMTIRGPKYIEILAPCPPGWRFPMEKMLEMGRLAVETGAWALYEYENKQLTFNLKSKAILEGAKPKPVEEYLRLQGRFAHLFKPQRNEEVIATIQESVNTDWDRFRRQVECGLA